MKTILKIITILLMATLVAGGFHLIVNQTTSLSSSDPAGEQPPALANTSGTRPEGPEGPDEGGASFGLGLLQVLVTLAKLSGIASLVLLTEKALERVQQGKLQRGLLNR